MRYIVYNFVLWNHIFRSSCTYSHRYILWHPSFTSSVVSLSELFSLLPKVSWEYKFEKAYVPMTVKMFLAYRVKVSFWHFNDMVWKNVFNYRIFKGHTLCENPNWQKLFSSMCKLSHTLFRKTHMMINFQVSNN